MKKSEIKEIAYRAFLGALTNTSPCHLFKAEFNHFWENNKEKFKEFITSPTLKEISHKVYYSMGVYSQVVIDSVELIEDEEELTEDVKGSYIYEINNLLEVIDASRTADIEVLNELIEFLEQ